MTVLEKIKTYWQQFYTFHDDLIYPILTHDYFAPITIFISFIVFVLLFVGKITGIEDYRLTFREKALKALGWSLLAELLIVVGLILIIPAIYILFIVGILWITYKIGDDIIRLCLARLDDVDTTYLNYYLNWGIFITFLLFSCIVLQRVMLPKIAWLLVLLLTSILLYIGGVVFHYRYPNETRLKGKVWYITGYRFMLLGGVWILCRELQRLARYVTNSYTTRQVELLRVALVQHYANQRDTLHSQLEALEKTQNCTKWELSLSQSKNARLEKKLEAQIATEAEQQTYIGRLQQKLKEQEAAFAALQSKFIDSLEAQEVRENRPNDLLDQLADKKEYPDLDTWEDWSR